MQHDPTMTADTAYLLAGYRLDPARGTLHGPDKALIPLRPKSMAVLLHLVQRPGRLVTREQLLDTVWAGVIVGDDSVTQAIRDVRRALGDASRQIVQTLPRRGYLLAASVTVLRSDAASGDAPRPSVGPRPPWLAAPLALAVFGPLLALLAVLALPPAAPQQALAWLGW